MKAITFIFATFLCLHSSAQTLDDFIEHAKQHHKLQAEDLKIESSFSEEKAATAWSDPQFQLAWGISPVETRVGPQVLRVGVQQNIPFSGIQNAKRKEAEANRSILTHEKALTFRELKFQVQNAYLQYFLTARQADYYKQYLQVNQEIREDRVNNMQQKMGHYSDVLVVDRMILQTKRMIRKMLNDQDKAILALEYWSGKDLEDTITLSTKFEIGQSTTQDSIHFMDHPALRQMEASQNLWQARQQKLKASAWPGVQLGVDYIVNASRQDVDILGNGRDAIVPKVGLSVPLSQQYYTHKEESQKMQIAALEEKKIDQLKWLKQQLAQARIDQMDATEEYEFYASQIKQTEEIIELIEIEISSDHTRFLEYWDYQKQLLEFRLSQLNSLKKWWSAAFIIEKIETSSHE